MNTNSSIKTAARAVEESKKNTDTKKSMHTRHKSNIRKVLQNSVTTVNVIYIKANLEGGGELCIVCIFLGIMASRTSAKI